MAEKKTSTGKPYEIVEELHEYDGVAGGQCVIISVFGVSLWVSKTAIGYIDINVHTNQPLKDMHIKETVIPGGIRVHSAVLDDKFIVSIYH